MEVYDNLEMSCFFFTKAKLIRSVDYNFAPCTWQRSKVLIRSGCEPRLQGVPTVGYSTSQHRKECAQGWRSVVLCLVEYPANFNHNFQGYFAGSWVIICLPQYQQRNSEDVHKPHESTIHG